MLVLVLMSWNSASWSVTVGWNKLERFSLSNFCLVKHLIVGPQSLLFVEHLLVPHTNWEPFALPPRVILHWKSGKGQTL